jgi:hypothetical protein
MAPKRPVATDSLTEDEKLLLVIATRMDSGLRRRDVLGGKVDLEWYFKCLDEELVRCESDPIL